MARALALLRDHPLLTPPLVVYAAAMLLAVALTGGPLVAVDLVLLAIYVALIHFATRRRADSVDNCDRLTGMRRDLWLAGIVASLQLAAVVVAWFVIGPARWLPAWSEGMRAAGVPPVVAATAANAALTVPLLLLPTLVTLAVFRVAPRSVGLDARARDLGLGLVLASIGVGLGAGAVATGNHPGLLWESMSIPDALAAILLQTLVNGLPEELAFRGVILGRLLPWLGRPGNSVALSALVFSLFHVPSLIALTPGHPAWAAVLAAFAGTGLPGLMFGYLFYRTRSIWPGVIWHTSSTGFGLMFA